MERKNKTILGGALFLLIGFLLFAFTFKVVYSNYFYSNLSLPFIHIIGEILMVCGLYLLIKEKMKINRFFKPTKWKMILFLIIFIILSKIFLSLWPNPIGTCLAIGCEPIFKSSRMLARFVLPVLVLSYLLSSIIRCKISKK